MKQCLLIIILGIVFSCSKSESLPMIDQTGRKIFYNTNEYSKSKNNDEEVVIVDTACISLKEKALGDIKANRLTYYYETIGPQ